MKHKVRRLLGNDGRVLICAMDHVNLLTGPAPGLVDYGRTVRTVAAGGADAFLSPLGSIVNFADDFGRTTIVASVETGAHFLPRVVHRALAVGADAVKSMVYPFTDEDWLGQSHKIGSDAARVGLPYIAEAIPGGFQDVENHTPEKIAVSARLAAETGADIVKTLYTGDPETMRQVIAYASVPVVVLGGPVRRSARDLFQDVYDAVIVAGCAGVAVGRNIWQAPDPQAITRGLAAIIHRGASVDEALVEAGELVAAIQ